MLMYVLSTGLYLNNSYMFLYMYVCACLLLILILCIYFVMWTQRIPCVMPKHFLERCIQHLRSWTLKNRIMVKDCMMCTRTEKKRGGELCVVCVCFRRDLVVSQLQLCCWLLARYVLVGHSYGGAVCLCYTHMYPSEVKGLGMLIVTISKNRCFYHKVENFM